MSSLTVITGCMFSGKTEELIRRLRRETIAGRSVGVFKPAIDNRYNETAVTTHYGQAIQAFAVDTASDFTTIARGSGFEVVGFDEVQFMSDRIVEAIEALVFQGVDVIVAGLDLDFKGEPFGPIPKLLALAEIAVKLNAVCVCKKSDGSICGARATRSFRKSDSVQTIVVGASDEYEARCRSCWHHS